MLSATGQAQTKHYCFTHVNTNSIHKRLAVRPGRRSVGENVLSYLTQLVHDRRHKVRAEAAACRPTIRCATGLRVGVGGGEVPLKNHPLDKTSSCNSLMLPRKEHCKSDVGFAGLWRTGGPTFNHAVVLLEHQLQFYMVKPIWLLIVGGRSARI